MTTPNSRDSGPTPDPRARPLAAGFAVLASLTYGLIVIGALVRANGAGLACPDWPLCFGEVIPAFDIKVGFEWGHRAIAGGLSLGFVGLSAACLTRPTLRSRLGVPIAVTAAILAVQILLGALTVWELLASWTVTSHLLAGNAFALGLVWIALRLREEAGLAVGPTLSATPGERVALTLCGVLLLGQMVLGGLVSSTYAGLACPDWPTCANGQWFPGFEGARGLHLLHRLTAYALLGALLASALVAHSSPAIARLARVALGIGVAQVAVGVANVLLRIPVEVTGAHSALAALLVLTVALALRQAWRRPAEPAGLPA